MGGSYEVIIKNKKYIEFLNRKYLKNMRTLSLRQRTKLNLVINFVLF